MFNCVIGRDQPIVKKKFDLFKVEMTTMGWQVA
jgi:hypothetical protein